MGTKIVASRGIPSNESLYLPSHDSAHIRSFEDKNESLTRNTWDLPEVLTFIFPKKYQEKYHQISLSFMQLLIQKTSITGSEISEFIKESSISKATFYNRVLPRLKHVGVIKVQRQTIIAKENLRKYRPMTITLSKTFGNYMSKIGDSWLALVDDARSKKEKQKRLAQFDEDH